MLEYLEEIGKLLEKLEIEMWTVRKPGEYPDSYETEDRLIKFKIKEENDNE